MDRFSRTICTVISLFLPIMAICGGNTPAGAGGSKAKRYAGREQSDASHVADNASLNVVAPASTEIGGDAEKPSWVHTVKYAYSTEFYPRKSVGVSERWYCYESRVIFKKWEGGMVFCLDYPNNKKTVYRPDTGTVLISYLAGSFQRDRLPTSPAKWVDERLKSLEGRGIEVKHEKGQYEGVDVDIYYLTDYRTCGGERFLWSESKVIVDRLTRLQIASEGKFWSRSGKLFDHTGRRWYYPEKGPKDIYELGVPKSAKVLDYSPTPELLKVMGAYQSYRGSFPTRYIATIAYAKDGASPKSDQVDSVIIFFCNSTINRRLEEFTFDSLSQEKLTGKWGDFADSLLKWRSGETSGEFNVRSVKTVLYDGKFRYSLERDGAEGDWSAVKKSKHPGKAKFRVGGLLCDRDIVSELGWPLELLEDNVEYNRTTTCIVNDNYSKESKLICVEVCHERLPKAWRFYLNPERDYICQRQEIYRQYGRDYKECFSVKEVPEYGRTDSGRWYPKKILERLELKKRSGTVAPGGTKISLKKILERLVSKKDDGPTEKRRTVMTICLDIDPKFPEGIFDPEKLSK